MGFRSTSWLCFERIADSGGWILLALALACPSVGCQSEPDTPQPPTNPILDLDLGAVEPQVREKIHSVWAGVEANRRSSEAWVRLGRTLHAHGFFAAALESYLEATRLMPEDYRWPYLAGLAQRKLDLQAALPLFERADRLSPDNPAFYINHGDLLLELNRIEEARRPYLKALDLDADSSFALLGLAQIDLAEANLESARRHLEKATAIEPALGQAHLVLSQVYRRLGDEDRSRVESLAARAHPEPAAPNDPVMAAVADEAVASEALSRRALTLARRKDYAAAEKIFREVIERRPANSRDYANLGGTLLGQGKTEEAVQVCRRALQINPSETHAHNTLALANLEQGRLDEAVAQARAAIAVDPNYAEAHHTLGLALARQGKTKTAEESYETALKINPALAGVRDDRAQILVSLGKLAEAIQEWRLAIALNPRELESYYNLAAAYALNKQYRESIETVEQGLARAPNSSQFVRTLAWLLATAPEEGLRDGPRALALASRLRAQNPDNPAFIDCYAAALAENGRYAEAVTAITDLLSRVPNPEAVGRNFRSRLQRYRRNQPFRQR